MHQLHPLHLGAVSHTALNAGNVVNLSAGMVAANLSGHGAAVSVSATGAVASIGVSAINTAEWVEFSMGPVTQIVQSRGTIGNAMAQDISVGNASGTGASVRASTTGAAASIAVTSILSDPQPITVGGSIAQQVTNLGPVTNAASINSTGTLRGLGSSASIGATGSTASVAVASIADTTVGSPVTALSPSITQTAINSPSSPVTNTGTITLGGGNMGTGASASIAAVGASASVSVLAMR